MIDKILEIVLIYMCIVGVIFSTFGLGLLIYIIYSLITGNLILY